MVKRRKLSTSAQIVENDANIAIPQMTADATGPPTKRRARASKAPQTISNGGSTNPDRNANVLDAAEALRASPDASGPDERVKVEEAGMDVDIQVKDEDDAETTNREDSAKPRKAGDKKSSNKKANASGPSEPVSQSKSATKEPQFLDPEADGDEEADEEELQAALSRPPPVNSDYLPLPWKGRLGYACLNTYLRFSNPPVFSSRTCRIASILENRHPLTFPNEPPHATKNRPDRTKPADVARGQAFVESLGKANAKDIVKMLRWNDRYGIKFLRLSSEMFPFASHAEYGYTLEPFVSEELAEAGRVAAELGHRLTTHPGQFTQLGSPRKQVIDNAIRDLEYHSELLTLLKLPPQQDRDAVMILHLGGVFGDKVATLDRFRENYAKLSDGIKYRLVLENDDVSWSVHELLPICEELNIPMVLDFHHHNIIFDAEELREGTKDIIDVFPRILATWKRKNKTPKMHYSEPTPAAITGRQRRKHNPRVATLPPCPPDMDLMIEAKDKEQAVFELMRTFKLPGFDTFSDITPHARPDENKAVRTPKKKKANSKKSKSSDNDHEEEPAPPPVVPDDEVGMGGPDGRVYWPPGMEHWLRPQKRVVKPKVESSVDGDTEPVEKKTTPARKKKAASAAQEAAVKVEAEVHANGDLPEQTNAAVTPTPTPKPKSKAKAKAQPASKAAAPTPTPKGKAAKAAKATPKARSITSDEAEEEEEDDDDDDDDDDSLSDLESDSDGEVTRTPTPAKKSRSAVVNGGNKRQSGRAKKQISYMEEGENED